MFYAATCHSSTVLALFYLSFPSYFPRGSRCLILSFNYSFHEKEVFPKYSTYFEFQKNIWQTAFSFHSLISIFLQAIELRLSPKGCNCEWPFINLEHGLLFSHQPSHIIKFYIPGYVYLNNLNWKHENKIIMQNALMYSLMYSFSFNYLCDNPISFRTIES